MFYVIENSYVGGNEDCHFDVDNIIISEKPACGNLSGEPVFDGWAGTTDDWSVVAHGEFESIGDAVAYVYDNFVVRSEGPDGPYINDVLDPDVVAMYRVGRYAQMTRQMTGDYLNDAFNAIVAADDDASLRERLYYAEEAAQGEGCTLHGDAFEMMVSVRDERIADLEYDNEEAPAV